MATTFSYFGYEYAIIDEEKKEVALYSAVNANERAVIPCSVEYNSKTYKVTAIGPVKVTVYRETAGVRETDGRKKNYWKVAPGWVSDGEDYISPFTRYNNPYSHNPDDRYGINKKITTIILPDSINELGDAAFRRCYGLKEVVNFPKGITKISDRLFSGCMALESIVLPEGITSIGKWAFIGCSALKEITIPSSVKTIDEFAFADSRQSNSGLEVVNIMNSEGGVIIHPEAFTDRVKINYLGKPTDKAKADQVLTIIQQLLLGKQTVNKAKTDKKTPKQEAEQVASPTPTIDLDKLIDAVVADGVITDKERSVILKKAKAAGYDVDEVEILLDGKLAEKKNERQSVPETETKVESKPASKPTSKTVKKKADIAVGEVDTDAMWADVVEQLDVVKNSITCSKGRPYISFASKTHKKNISYWAGYSPRGEYAWVCIETYGGEAARDAIMSIVKSAPKGHICTTAEMKQGTRNKEKWMLMTTTSIDKPTSELVEWYVENLLAYYKFFEDAKPF